MLNLKRIRQKVFHWKCNNRSNTGYLHPLPVGVADDDEPVEGDDGHGHGGDVDGDALGHGEERAEDFTEQPLAGEGLDGGEGDREAAHEDVRTGQARDEQVGRVLHWLVLEDDVGNQKVAKDANQEDGAVQWRGQDLEGQVVDQLLKLWIALWITVPMWSPELHPDQQVVKNAEPIFSD